MADDRYLIFENNIIEIPISSQWFKLSQRNLARWRSNLLWTASGQENL